MIAKMTSKGQITIPAEVRKKIGLHAGDRVDFVCHGDNKVELIPLSATVKSLRGMVPKPKKKLTLDEMDAAIHAGVCS